MQRTKEDKKIEPAENETRPREYEEIGLLVYTINLSENTKKRRIEMLHISTREKKDFKAALTSSVHRVVTTEHFNDFAIPFFYRKEDDTGRFVFDKEMRGIFNDLNFKSKVLRQDKRKRHRILDLFLPNLRSEIGV